ncbi:uncharacterized protein FTJAE_11469 [Fusarium tjaetaba]|uniref:Uncharacterized protein n=1 Tax=Fusarium tjaetaba TaxID=1567544 RepID=A0A8H5QV52_9HYPO|nr:uncharacterized protein FTJAE_11469 [Fusarium tjaetaba]KAF5621128.1 hypothetical protein FTJAE_11469 [Fusarium tjaetaba]
MTNYSLTVKVPVQSFRQLSQEGYKLCFASGVEREGFKVIALTTGEALCSSTSTYTDVCDQDIAPFVMLQCNDDYAIAASGSSFMEGAKVQAYTNVDSIRLGQTYTLTPDFQGRVNDGGRQGAIQFNNQTDRAAPIIYRSIGDSKVPFYVGSQQLPRGSSQVIQPNNRVAVWFQRDAETGMMISRIDGNFIEIDMSGRTSATVVSNEDFTWSLQ